MAVPHGVSCMLALSVSLAEEVSGQTAGAGEGAGVRGVTQVHHLINNEKSLVAALLLLAEFL